MKVVVAPDSYKECLTAQEVAAAIATGVRRMYPEAEVIEKPLADGGEGTLSVLAPAMGAKVLRASVSDPFRRPVEAAFGVAGDMGIIEIAQACGMGLLVPSERNPLLASTYGVGELIMAAYDAGCRKYIIGLGGSVTCDGGVGMLSVPGIKEVLANCSFELLCDVTAPFVGPTGAARVFAPQKGASEEDVEILEARMCALASQMKNETGVDVSDAPGAGAAGGLGGAFMAYAGAKMVSGIDRVMDLVGLDEAVRGAGLVITGEGRFDAQTMSGKVPYGVLRRCNPVRVAVVAGSVDWDCSELRKIGFSEITEVSNTYNLEEAMKPENAKANIIRAVDGMLSGMKALKIKI